MNMRVAVFLLTVFIFTCVGEFRLEIPSQPRLAVSAILIGAAMVSLGIAWRRHQKTDH